jgi:GTPase involved in cell partitioning and DNA repair
VWFEVAQDVDTLLDFAGRHHWRAGNGNGGEGQINMAPTAKTL